MSVAINDKRKNWLLHQARTATFYQLEAWAALYEIERLIGAEGGMYGVVETFS
jgi:hypothetical protein